jgi:hypothetical protein
MLGGRKGECVNRSEERISHSPLLHLSERVSARSPGILRIILEMEIQQSQRLNFITCSIFIIVIFIIYYRLEFIKTHPLFRKIIPTNKEHMNLSRAKLSWAGRGRQGRSWGGDPVG